MEALASVKLWHRTSSFGIVKAVEQVLHQMPRTMETAHGEVAAIFVIQALSYATRIMTDPWSKFYPTKEEVVAECLKSARINVVLVGDDGH
jgi:hypothetical protein